MLQRDRRAVAAVLAAAGLAAALRLPFTGTGLSMDEGGYAHVAREWSRGVPLYREAWLDRPQGLLLTYRLLLGLDHDGGAIRLGAVVAGMLITLGVGTAGWQLAGRRAGVVAAALYATVGVAPRLEGFTLNGELLASVPATFAVVAALGWRRQRQRQQRREQRQRRQHQQQRQQQRQWRQQQRWRERPEAQRQERLGEQRREQPGKQWRERRHGPAGWLVVAGLAGAAALTMKPSGLDGLTATLAVLAVTTGRRPHGYGLALTGAAVPVGLCVLHGVSLGWSDYWQALAGYQFAALGGPHPGTGDRAAALLRSLGAAAPELATLGLAAALALAPARTAPTSRPADPTSSRAAPASRHADPASSRAAPAVRHADLTRVRRHRPIMLILAGWLAGGVVGVNLGGSYWPHYWVQLLPPLAVAAAVAVTRISRPALRTGLVGVLLLPQVLWLAALIPASPQQRRQAVPYAEAARRDARIAAAIRAATGPDDRIFVLVSQADLYFLADRRTDYPYLWGKPIEKIPDALPRLRAMLDGPERPRLVVLNHDPARVDPSGATGRILAARYRPWRTVEGVPLLRAI